MDFCLFVFSGWLNSSDCWASLIPKPTPASEKDGDHKEKSKTYRTTLSLHKLSCNAKRPKWVCALFSSPTAALSETMLLSRFGIKLSQLPELREITQSLQQGFFNKPKQLITKKYRYKIGGPKNHRPVSGNISPQIHRSSKNFHRH